MKEDGNSPADSGGADGAQPAPRHNGSPVPFFSDATRAQIKERLLYIAQRRYRFREEIAENLVDATLETYLEAHTRYAAWVDHATQIVGILRGKCREHIRRQICLTAQGNAIRDVMPGTDVPAALAAGALDEIASRDVRRLIFEALAELRPKALEALQSLRTGATRLDLLDLIERLGLNKQADASSIGAYRDHIRHILARCGIRL